MRVKRQSHLVKIAATMVLYRSNFSEFLCFPLRNSENTENLRHFSCSKKLLLDHNF